MTQTVEPVLLEKNQVDAATGVLVRSFEGDPMINYLVKDTAKRQRFATKFFKATVRYCLEYGEVYTMPKLQGVACWLPPTQASYKFIGLVRSGMLWLPFQVGTADPQRMMALGSVTEKVRKQFAPTPHWYLLALGVDANQQGRGIGGQLIQPILHRADRERTPCYLETQKEINVPFYQKHGFRVVSQQTVGQSDLEYWGMLRDPQNKSVTDLKQ